MGSRGLGVRMLGPQGVRALGGIGLVLALACGYPIVRNLLISVPAANVASCKVTFSHNYYVYVTLNSGRTLVLDSLDVPEPARCLPPGTTIEKARGEFGYRIDGEQFFWEAKHTRSYAMGTVAGALAAAAALVIGLRAKRAHDQSP